MFGIFGNGGSVFFARVRGLGGQGLRSWGLGPGPTLPKLKCNPNIVTPGKVVTFWQRLRQPEESLSYPSSITPQWSVGSGSFGRRFALLGLHFRHL